MAVNTGAIGAALAQVNWGTKVDRASSTLPQTTQTPYFHVYGGRCFVTMLLGEVTVVHAGAANDLSWESDPTVGTTNAMCAAVEGNAAEVGTLMSITGTVGDAMILGKSGAVKAQLAPIAVAVGDLEFKAAASRTGETKWSLWYIPIDDGAYILAV